MSPQPKKNPKIPNTFSQEILKELRELKDENMRLRIENNLLRAASEEQRKLNGELRVALGEANGAKYVHYGLF